MTPVPLKKKKSINNYSFNEWCAKYFKYNLRGTALAVYSSYHRSRLQGRKRLIFGSQWEQRFWWRDPACLILKFSLQVQLRKKTCSWGCPWQWRQARRALKGKGKVNLTGRVGCLCQFQQRLPQPVSISWLTQQKLRQQHLSSSHSLPVQLLGLAS